MNRRHLNDLPPEVINLILTSLPIPSLLSLSRTSRYNYALAIRAFKVLELAILPKEIHCSLAFLKSHCHTDGADDDGSLSGPRSEPRSTTELTTTTSSSFSSLYVAAIDSDETTRDLNQIALATGPLPQSITDLSRDHLTTLSKSDNDIIHSDSYHPPSPPPAYLLRTHHITQQNLRAATVLSAPTASNLRSLTLHAYALHTPELATILATGLTDLHHLHLDFSHPYINDTSLPRNYWRDTPGNGSGSHIWNVFGGIGQANSEALKLTGLRSLELRRAGITCLQLRRWIERNPELKCVTLEKVRGVDREFCAWLGGYVGGDCSTSEGNRGNGKQCSKPRGKIEKLALTDCGNLSMRNEPDFDWIRNIVTSSGNAAPNDLDRGENPWSYNNATTTPPCRGSRKPAMVLKALSLRDCRQVSEPTFLDLARGSDAVNETLKAQNLPYTSSGNHRICDTDRIHCCGSDTDANGTGWKNYIGKIVSPGGVIIT